MSRPLSLSVGVGAVLCAGAAFVAASAGGLTPPSGPVAPSMHTMSEVFDAVANPGSQPFQCVSAPSGITTDLPLIVNVSGLPGAGGAESFTAVAFSHSITRATTGGPAMHSSITITKQLDKSTSKIAKACADGTHLGSAVLICRKAGDAHVYMQYTLSDVVISAFHPAFGPACEGNSLALEEVSFSYASLTIACLDPGGTTVTIPNSSPPVN